MSNLLRHIACPVCRVIGWLVPEWTDSDGRPHGFKCIRCGAGTLTRGRKELKR